jgi:hypothetical protein
MEKWITRAVAALCAAGSTALFWTFGIFLCRTLAGKPHALAQQDRMAGTR